MCLPLNLQSLSLPLPQSLSLPVVVAHTLYPPPSLCPITRGHVRGCEVCVTEVISSIRLVKLDQLGHSLLSLPLSPSPICRALPQDVFYFYAAYFF